MSILWNPTEATVVEKVSLPVITTGTQNMGDGIYWLKAGTPLDEDLAVANDGDAVYIVAEDFFFVSTNPNQDRHVPLIKAGYVDINKAEASAGITFADAAKSALETAGIVLVDGLLDAGGSNGGVLLITVTQDAEYNLVADKTYAEAVAALEAGSTLLMHYAPGGTFYQLDQRDTSSLWFSYVQLDTTTGEVVKFFLVYTSSGLYVDTSSQSLFALPQQIMYSGEDGTYMLTCTVSDDGSNISYDWTSLGT